jgi:MFS family permease
MHEDETGKIIRIDTGAAQSQSVSFWDGFHRLVSDDKLLRLVGASGAWFLMDAAYYGNTVSSPLVLSALGGKHTLLNKTLTQLSIFAVFALPGYVVSALTVDRLGRKTIQTMGFALMAVAFALLALIPGIEKMTMPFLVIYGLSFFSRSSDPTPQPSSIRRRSPLSACEQPLMASLPPWAHSAASASFCFPI